MKNYLYILVLILALFAVACEEVIEIDLNSSDPVVVAEGGISKDSAVWLKLSYSTDYFTIEEAQMITDAEVSISDDAGQVHTLVTGDNGLYTAPDVLGRIGHTYTMAFTVDGQRYEASSVLMSPTRIITVSYEAMEMGMREKMQDVEYYMPTVRITDHPNEENYYRFIFYVDGEQQDGFFLTTDRAAKQGELEYSPLRMAIEGGNQVKVEVYSIDEATYTYYSQLDDLSGDMMDSSTPYNPQSNFGAEVMGFFSAQSSDSYTGAIE